MLTTRIPCSDGPKNFASQPGPQATLDVRHRFVHSGDGTQDRRATVCCPEREQSIPLQECMQCDRCAGLYHDPKRGHSQVLCGAASEGSVVACSEPAMYTPISAIMARDVVCVRSDLSVETLMMLFVEHSISGVPVVDDAGNPIGVISKTDLVRTMQDQDGTSGLDMLAFGRGDAPEMGRGLDECPFASGTVGEIMTPVSITLPENATVAQAAALMAYEGIHRLPVVGASQEVVGLVSSIDVLRWIARRSGYVVPRATRKQRA